MAIGCDQSPIARRAILAGVCTLPFAALAVTLAMAASNGPAWQPDPVFAAIEAHTVALKEWHAASDAFAKAEEALLERAGSFVPTISVDFLRSKEIHYPWQVDQFVRYMFDDEDTRARIASGLKQQLVESERRIEAVKAELGWNAVDERRRASSDREMEMRAALIGTVPTTMAGCLALLDRLLSREVLYDGGGDNEDEIQALETLRLALRQIAAEPSSV